MLLLPSLAVFVFAHLAAAHGDHGHDGPAAGETIQQYAERHMAREHHIDSFDPPAFFQLHDLNGDKIWDREEIEAIYGVHHVYSQRKSKDDIEHQKKADLIVNTVLDKIDKDKDGKITLEEFLAVGLDGLPNFDNLGAEGHHYDVESEFFLHHEEEFHSTPDTQTDESYTHPEDLEHFAQHEHIEHEEAEREARFQGISVDEALKQHEPHPEDKAQQPVQVASNTGGNSTPEDPADDPALQPAKPGPVIPKFTRGKQEDEDPAVRYQNAKASGQWGEGGSGYAAPKAPSERLKKNTPYKYKFRRNWGDF
ncbi:precursor to secretory protein Ssp120 [Rhodofomes roseus]|uniref:Precursor to secretory protein Ssp120 n=1 Tax=Rhodofomes roseus TaxID=34475 RepID=A0ABQ8KHV1_9APHY|nr:precursor to secretory protein Ssp120 [Rhodofomes roseus]KAH9837329.1 precursor to secretory protein Ssp120 [Rhodofomes roseus]